MIPRRIVAFGASTVHGSMDAAGCGFVGRLKNWHETNDPMNQVFNLGISGETTTRMLERFTDEVGRRRPHLIIMSLGLNCTSHIGHLESPNRTPVDQFRSNVETLIFRARALADVLFIGVFPIDDSRTRPYAGTSVYFSMDDARVYEEITRSSCSEHNVPYLRLLDGWTAESLTGFLHGDGLHASSLGHEDIFLRLRSLLEELYEDPSEP